jgi:hypothetical protein
MKSSKMGSNNPFRPRVKKMEEVKRMQEEIAASLSTENKFDQLAKIKPKKCLKPVFPP